MKMRIALAINAGVALCIWLAQAAPNNEQFVAFHPITQSQYDAILGLTDGQPVISEARLIASGIAALKGLVAGIRIGLSTRWLPSFISNFIGNERNTTKEVLELPDGYPLCVVKQQNDDSDDDHDEDISRGGGYEQTETLNRVSIVKCVVVVKQDPFGNYGVHTTTTTEPPEIEDPQNEPEEVHYDYHYPPWYHAPESYPHYHNDYTYNDYSAPNYRVYPNTYNSGEQEDYQQHYTKPQKSHSYKSKPHKTSTKNRKRHPSSPTRKRTKTKRDQYPTHTHQQNYARISNYPEGGYQPAAYPQVSYQSQYPKVSYSTSYNYPSPVYVRQTTNSDKNQQSEESQESEEYSRSRKD